MGFVSIAVEMVIHLAPRNLDRTHDEASILF